MGGAHGLIAEIVHNDYGNLTTASFVSWDSLNKVVVGMFSAQLRNVWMSQSMHLTQVILQKTRLQRTRTIRQLPISFPPLFYYAYYRTL